MRYLSSALAAIVAAAVGCSDHDRPAPPPRQRRVIEPPTATVRPQPPYAIRADGVGPYRIGEKLSDLLEQLPSGPRIALFEIPSLLHRSLLRAEEDTVLIGGEPTSTATFIAVVGKDVARTETGIHVGSTRDELVRALGPDPTQREPDRARDPRMIAATSPGNLRIILDEDRIAAIVVTADTYSSTPRAPREAGPDGACPRPAATEKAFGTCLTGGGELVEVNGDEVTVRAPESERAVGTLRIPNLVFAAPLRNSSEGRDELVAITRTDDGQVRSWSLVAYRYEGGRIVRTIEPSALYQVSTSNARWIGADLRDIDLYLELQSRPDAIEVGGLLSTHSDARPQGSWRDVVVISPVSVVRKRGKSAGAEGTDAGVIDAPADRAPAGAAGAGASKL